jgi:hypothetical protein
MDHVSGARWARRGGDADGLRVQSATEKAAGRVSTNAFRANGPAPSGRQMLYLPVAMLSIIAVADGAKAKTVFTVLRPSPFWKYRYFPRETAMVCVLLL